MRSFAYGYGENIRAGNPVKANFDWVAFQKLQGSMQMPEMGGIGKIKT
jgi:hypothetical protein